MKPNQGLALGAAFIAALFVLGVFYWAFESWQARSLTSSTQVAELKFLDQLETEGLKELNGHGLQGESFSLSRVKSPVLVLNFWASWCGPCVQEVPSLIELIEKDSSVEIVAVSEDSSRADIDSFLKSFPGMKNPRIHLLWDEDRKLMELYRAEKLPESFVFGPQRKLAKKVVGSINWSSEDALQYLRSLNPKSP